MGNQHERGDSERTLGSGHGTTFPSITQLQHRSLGTGRKVTFCQRLQAVLRQRTVLKLSEACVQGNYYIERGN